MNIPLSMQDILNEMRKKEEDAMARADSQREAIRTRLLKLFINKVTIHFAGAGDSGSIEEVEIEMVNGYDLDKIEEKSLKADLKAWADTFLEGTGVDWYNNEGGQGEIIFDMSTVPLKLIANVDVNITTSETEFYIEEML